MNGKRVLCLNCGAGSGEGEEVPGFCDRPACVSAGELFRVELGEIVANRGPLDFQGWPIRHGYFVRIKAARTSPARWGIVRALKLEPKHGPVCVVLTDKGETRTVRAHACTVVSVNESGRGKGKWPRWRLALEAFIVEARNADNGRREGT